MLSLRAPLVLLLLIPLAVLAVVAGQRLAANAGSRRRALVLAARCASLALLIVVLAQPVRSATGATPSVLFVVDTSASVSGVARSAEASWIRGALASLPPGAARGMVLFAGSARLAAAPTRSGAVTLAPASDTGQTNIAGALRLALSAAPGNTRLVLLSDGRQTVGDALAVAATARARHVPIDVVAVSPAEGVADAAFTRLQAPDAVHQGDALPLLLTVRSTVARQATVSLTQDGQAVGQETVHLRRGDNPFLVTLQAPAPGWHTYHALVTMNGDAVAQNNALDTTTRVVGPPQVLVVAAGGDASTATFVALLRRLELTVRTVAPRALPTSARALERYDGVVLNDLPAADLSKRQVAAMDVAVRVGGVGLLVLGGPHSLTLGHYTQTPLEQLLPVYSVTPGSLQKGNVALQLVLDRSGSMNNLAGNEPKILMSQAAANIAVTFALQHTDDLGIVSFDIVPHTLVPLQKVANAAIARHIHGVVNAMTADGGTNIYAALRRGLNQVLQSSAPYKHIILMTDGVSEPASYAGLLALMARHSVTLSTVGLGSDADVNLLRTLARGGKGRFYYTNNAADLPHIFAEEARLSVGPTTVAGTISVALAASSPVIRSVSAATALPPVRRYAATVLKPNAVADLVAHVHGRGPDPLLSQWQYGLGRVLVWAPGAKQSWAGAWIGKENSLWQDATQWMLRGVPPQTLAPRLLTASMPPQVEVDTLQNSGTFINLAHLSGFVTAPGSRVRQRLTFEQVGPGQYQAALPSGQPGVYRFTLRRESAPQDTVTSALALPYPQEYALSPPNLALLSSLAADTGGRMLSTPRQLSPRPAPTPQQDLWWPLVALALLLFLVDVTLRLLGGSTPSSRHVLAGAPGTGP